MINIDKLMIDIDKLSLIINKFQSGAVRTIPKLFSRKRTTNVLQHFKNVLNPPNHCIYLAKALIVKFLIYLFN